jgi:hypothetical protein
VHLENLEAGWWYTHPSEKYEFVSWDHYSQHMEKKTVPNHQPGGDLQLKNMVKLDIWIIL